MKYLGYAFAAVVGYWVGLTCKARTQQVLRKKTINIQLRNNAGEWLKEIDKAAVEVHPGDIIEWIIATDVPARVLIDDFRDLVTGVPKAALTRNPAGLIRPPGGRLIGVVRGKDVFDEPPHGHQDQFGRYQDFTYGVEIDGQRVDPEIRIREY